MRQVKGLDLAGQGFSRGRSGVWRWQVKGFRCGRSKVWAWQVKGLGVAGQGFGCGRPRASSDIPQQHGLRRTW